MALISCAVLLYEIAITRVLSVVVWYHFAFLHDRALPVRGGDDLPDRRAEEDKAFKLPSERFWLR